MAVLKWKPGLTIKSLDPSDVEDLEWDFSEWVGNETLTDATLETDNITATVTGFTGAGVVTVRLGPNVGNTAYGKYTVVLTTNSGRVRNRSVRVVFREL